MISGMRRLRLIAKRVRPESVSALCRVLFGAVIIIFAVEPVQAAQQLSGSANLSGTVHNAQGGPATGATLRLQAKDGAEILTTRTDKRGQYNFASLPEGVYELHAETEAGAESAISSPTVSSIFLGRNEHKKLDLTLEAGQSPPLQPVASSPTPSAASAPEFFDQPKFTVSGVTDTTSLGGHGSDTIVRTRDALAKETASLAQASDGRPLVGSASSEVTLREKADHDPPDFSANHNLGQLLLQRGRAREAILYLDRAAKLNPSDYENAYDVALANENAGDYERARTSTQALLSVHDGAHDHAELHHLLADAEEKLGNSLEAVREYERAAALNPTEPYIFDWGSELLLHHAPEPAFEVFSRGNDLFPHSVRMLVGIGATWFARGSYDQAVKQICTASDLDPHDPAPYLFLGQIESAQTPPEALVEKLRQFVVLNPDANAHYYYAVALWKRRNTASDEASAGEVESLLNKAVRLDPKFSAAYLQLGILHSDQKHFSQAISDYQHALQSDDPRYPDTRSETHYRLAQAYRQTGDLDKAKAESLLYDQAARESAQQIERERHEIRQFVYTLRDQPPAQKH
jgi:tetratricopeptide (TPR) repeat protein